MKQLREISPLWLGVLSLLLSVFLIDRSARAVNYSLAQQPFQRHVVKPQPKPSQSNAPAEEELQPVESARTENRRLAQQPVQDAWINPEPQKSSPSQSQLRQELVPYTGFLAVELEPDYVEFINNHPRSSLEVTETSGYLVAHVFADGPAQAAGLQVGDIITDDTDLVFNHSDIGAIAMIKIIRKQEFLFLDVPIGWVFDDNPEALERVDPGIIDLVTPPPLSPKIPLIGIIPVDTNSDYQAISRAKQKLINGIVGGQESLVDGDQRGDDKIYEFLNEATLDDQRGLLIAYAHKDTPAWQAGLRYGDVITTANGIPVNTLEEFVNIVQANVEAGVKIGFQRITTGWPEDLIKSYFVTVYPEVRSPDALHPYKLREREEIKNRWAYY